jgi:hypothetical protein
MKMKLLYSTLLSLLFASSYAQDRTTVNAMSSEISDNLDLRAVASIFGDSRDLEDFENRLNDPKNQISNLDLNGDNQVDYLRVIESVEGRTHLIVVQSVLGRDTFQDVATLEVEKDRNNRVQIQVVGDVYMYGSNYIYEPVYVNTPIIYDYFWTPNYRPYCSVWYWNYYPSYYFVWNPCPIFRYRDHIGLYINFNHHYNYVNYRRCQSAYNNYYGRRGNGYEREHPNYSFERRNSGYTNRYELDKTRNIRTVGTPKNTNYADATPRNSGTRNVKNDAPRNTNYSEGTPRNNGTRNVKSDAPRNTNYSEGTPRNNGTRNVKSDTPRNTNYSEGTPRNNGTREVKNDTPRNTNYSEGTPRNNDTREVKSDAPRNTNYSEGTPRNNGTREVKNDTPRTTSPNVSPRSNQPRSYSNESPRNSSPKNLGTASPRGSERRNSGSNEGNSSRSTGRR